MPIATPMQIAKKWFNARSDSIVVDHWRWNELSAASLERLRLPRTHKVIGHRVVFGPHQSELSLKGITAATIHDDDTLELRFAASHMYAIYKEPL